jgi:putative zinc finger/helix-turn-helix YgiT family protein
MKSFCPHCEKETSATSVLAQLEYTIKGVDVSIEAPLIKCDVCENEFESPEMGHDVAELALRAYRKEVGLLSPEEIKVFRKSLGLTQHELSELLGWGGATLSRYENGALQDEAHDRAMRMIMEPDALLGIIENNPGLLSQEKRGRLVEKLKTRENAESAYRGFFKRFLTDYQADINSGYRRFDAKKFFAMVLHFCRDSGIPKTKLNKLLWYSDFLSFKHNTVSISGTKYAHLPFGPCPDNYDVFIAYLTDIDKSLSVVEQSSGIYSWEVLVSSCTPDYSLFTNSEIHVLSSVAKFFEDKSANEICDISHGERGFQETSDGQIISYDFADGLVGVD